MLEDCNELTPTGETIEEYRERYVRSRLLENMLLGVHPQVIREEQRRLDMRFHFSETEYYLVLTGIGMTADRRYLQDNDQILLTRNPRVAEQTGRLFAESGWDFERAAINPEKICCLILSRNPQAQAWPINEVRRRLIEIYQREYDKYIPNDGMSCRAFVVRSEALHGIEEIHTAYTRLCELHALSFFEMGNYIIDEAWLAEKKRSVNEDEIIWGIEECWKSLYETEGGEVFAALARLKQLMLDGVKRSFCFSLAERALFTFRHEYERWLHAFWPQKKEALDLRLRDFATIEEMTARIERIFSCCAKEAGDRRVANPITYRVVRYIEEHYQRPEVLNEAAEYFRVTPRYLRKVFSEDMHIGLYEYLTNLRIGQAKALLLLEGACVGEVARQVGFESAGYFSQFFKKHAGVLPSDWKKSGR